MRILLGHHFKLQLKRMAEQAPPEKLEQALQDAKEMADLFSSLPKVNKRIAINYDENITQKNKWKLTNFKSHLYLHQVLWLLFAVRLDQLGSGLLADVMGLGKTVEALTLITIHQRNALPRATLIVVPSGLKEQWRREIEKHCDLEALHGNPAFICYDNAKTVSLKPEHYERASIVLVSYDDLTSPKSQALIDTVWYRIVAGKTICFYSK